MCILVYNVHKFVFAREDLRGSGLGKVLVGHVLEAAREAKATFILVHGLVQSQGKIVTAQTRFSFSIILDS